MAASDIARAYAICRGVFALRALWADIQALDNLVPAERQYEMLEATIRVAEAGKALVPARNLTPRCSTSPFNIEDFSRASPSSTAGHRRADLRRRQEEPARTCRAADQGRCARRGWPIASLRLDFLAPGLDIVRMAKSAKPHGRGGRQPAIFAVGRRFHIDRLRSATSGVNLDTHWDRLAVAAIVEDLYGHQRDLAASGHAAGQWCGDRQLGRGASPAGAAHRSPDRRSPPARRPRPRQARRRQSRVRGACQADRSEPLPIFFFFFFFFFLPPPSSFSRFRGNDG